MFHCRKQRPVNKPCLDFAADELRGLGDGVPVVPVGEGGHDEEGEEHGNRANVEKLVVLYVLG